MTLYIFTVESETEVIAKFSGSTKACYTN